MRLVIAGTIVAAALAFTPASAQAPKIEGSKAFCLKDTAKLDCSYDTMAACQKGMKDKAKDSTSGGSCVSRSEAR
jgi:hypothetical protein